jgi:hypothetical protein
MLPRLPSAPFWLIGWQHVRNLLAGRHIRSRRKYDFEAMASEPKTIAWT